MYRIKDIEDGLLHLIGWRQSYDLENQISKDMVKSESGLFFQGAHPLVTLDNVRSIMPKYYHNRYPDWNSIPTYYPGDKVRVDDVVYIATSENQDMKPRTSDFSDDFYQKDFGGPWHVFDPLSDYLEVVTREGIDDLVQKFIQAKKLTQGTRNLLEHKSLYNRLGRIKEVIRSKSNLVGLAIQPKSSMGITIRLDKLGFQSVGASGNVTLYLFNSNKIDPIKTFTINVPKDNGSMVWTDQEVFLPYSTDGIVGGTWFLCYNQDDLPMGMEAINVSKDWRKNPCGTCGVDNLNTWKQLMRYVEITPFYTVIDSDFSQKPELWDTESNIYTNLTTYGLNAILSVGCDLTDFFISQRNIFQTALQKQVGYNALRKMAMNPNANVSRNQSNVSRLDVLYELDGNTNGERPNGLGADLEKAYKALSLETKGIDPVCLPCHNKGVRVRAI